MSESPFRIPESARTAVAPIVLDPTRLRMPAWYRTLCDKQSRAVYRGQITESESALALDVFHAAALREALAARDL